MEYLPAGWGNIPPVIISAEKPLLETQGNEKRQSNVSETITTPVMVQSPQTGGVMVGIIWMFGIGLLLCWVPFFGPLIAGLVGGKKSGGVLNGIMAALLPSLAFASLLLAATSIVASVPVFGAIATLGSIAIAFAGGGPLLAGAIVGGLFSGQNAEPVSSPALAFVLIATAFMGWRVYTQIEQNMKFANNAAVKVSDFATGIGSHISNFTAGAGGSIAQGSQRTEDGALQGDLTLDALKNFRYSTEQGPVLLVKGEYSGSLSDGTPLIATFISAAFGHLDHDGTKDAVVHIEVSNGGSGVYPYLIAILNKASGRTQVSVTPLGDRDSIKSISIDENSVVADVLLHAADDPSCCPSVRRTATFLYFDEFGSFKELH